MLRFWWSYRWIYMNSYVARDLDDNVHPSTKKKKLKKHPQPVVSGHFVTDSGWFNKKHEKFMGALRL